LTTTAAALLVTAHSTVRRPVHEQRKQAYGELQKQLKAATTEETTADTSKQEVLREKEKVTRRIQELSSKAKTRIDVSDLETELASTEQEIAAQTAALKSIEERRTELQAQFAPLQLEVDAIAAERAAANELCDGDAAAYEAVEQQEAALQQVRVKAADFLQTRKAAASEAAAALLRAEAAHEKALQQAEVSTVILL
jgi:chromosome segregation ATPase